MEDQTVRVQTTDFASIGTYTLSIMGFMPGTNVYAEMFVKVTLTNGCLEEEIQTSFE